MHGVFGAPSECASQKPGCAPLALQFFPTPCRGVKSKLSSAVIRPMGSGPSRTLRAIVRGSVGCAFLMVCASAAFAGDLDEAQELFRSGHYAKCLVAAKDAVAERTWSQDWQVLLTKTLLTVGRYAEAQVVVSNAVERFPNPRMRWLAREVFLSNGRRSDADEMVDGILQSLSGGRASDAESLIALGHAALLKGVEPKVVLDRLYNPAKKSEPNSPEVYLAIGALALEKHDFALAAKTFQEGLKKLPDDPDLLHGLAEAYEPSEPSLMIETLQAALNRNSNHIASLLLLADHAIDAEAYTEAAQFLDRIHQINPWQPEAWAYRAVTATLQNQPKDAASAREKALKFWAENPLVPHLIGRKLSQKYRFAEGAALQREALQFDPGYLRAKAQLAQDLLRLGEETEGWQLADEVQKADPYNVTANNLMSLHDTMHRFQTLTNDHFHVRMTPHEAALYGPRVLALLGRAREKLLSKYGASLVRPTLVEVFTNQADFGVRTFAMPQNDGYLGVCFGNVITANSPGAYPGHPFNWEAMLWHEFCHVITLNLTNNKMPRWLSEGISVYEERQANPAWGEHLKPNYRSMILEGELTPIKDLSAAFLMPPSGEHLQFAYYESSLVVQFIVERFGFSNLQAILRDLGEGAEINQAIAKHTLPMNGLEKDFAAFAKEVAGRLGPQLDWEQPGLVAHKKVRRAQDEKLTPPTRERVEPVDPGGFSWESWGKAHPSNYYAMIGRAGELVDRKQWQEAKPILERMVKLCPECIGPQSPYVLLAETYRSLGETNEERKLLGQLAERDDAASDAFLRLMELTRDSQDWKSTALNARRYLAVNPLVPVGYRFLAEAADKTGDTRAAIEACRALLELDPPDPAEVNYHLARLLYSAGDPAARRHVLQALEEAPRYREALRLLLEINKKETPGNQAASF
jgi:tetratricopeptide (TPR) repeat protein